MDHSFAAELSTPGMPINSLSWCNSGFGKIIFTFQLFLAAPICVVVRRKDKDENQCYHQHSTFVPNYVVCFQ